MNKTIKNSLILLIVLTAAVAMMCIIYQYFKSEPISANNIAQGNIVPNYEDELNNKSSENIENNLNNDETNNVNSDENKVENTLQNNSVDNGENTSTPKENKAISLAKEEWLKERNSLQGLEFNVSIQTNGKYLVTVYDTKTTRLIKGYVVDVETEIVNEK